MQGLSAPTDSIYKFSAIAGLLLIAASGIGIYDMSRSELLARREMVACYAQTIAALKEDKNDVAAEKFVTLATDAMTNKKVALTCGRSLRKLNANPEAIDAACRFDVATIAAAQENSVLSTYSGYLFFFLLGGIILLGFGIHRWYFLEQKLKDMEVKQKILDLTRTQKSVTAAPKRDENVPAQIPPNITDAQSPEPQLAPNAEA